jgi:glutaminyl-peptide cyclotransferase
MARKSRRSARERPSSRPTRLWVWGLLAAGALVVYLAARGRSELPAQDAVAWYDYQVVNAYPHDRGAFTQGLIFREGFLFESTGLNGQSSLRKVRLETGEVIERRAIAPEYFAEGLTDFGNRLVQLTWQSNRGFVYDLPTFAVQRTFDYPGEGWGLARDETRLIMSDGTSTLRFLNPDTLRETGRLTVTDGLQPVENLNELEMVKDELFANVWTTDQIVIVSPRTGRVTGRIDLTGLLPPSDRVPPVDVLNGIAWDAERDRLFVTGKLWPRLFEIRLRRRPSP